MVHESCALLIIQGFSSTYHSVKGLFGILPKKDRKKSIELHTMITQGDLFSFVFLGELKTPKTHFEIN